MEHVRFEFLSYFDYGSIKWGQCGMEYSMGEDAFISDQTMQKYENRFRENGLCVVKT